MKNYLRLTFKDLLLFAILIILFAGCKKEKITEETFMYKNGVFITCEGKFPDGTGTISFFNREGKIVRNDIFQIANGRPLGSIVQSMTIFNNRAYIIVNGGGKTEVVDANNFKSTGVINELTLPRYFIGIDKDKGYISDWANNVAVINLNTLKVSKTIPTGTGPELMFKYFDKVFVLNKGGFTYDSNITVIDSENDIVVKTIKVFDVPAGICIDKNHKLWVLCSGNGWNGFPQSSDTKGHLLRIDPISYTIEKNIEFPATDKHPDKLSINSNNDVLYYNYIDGVYTFGIEDNELQTTPIIKLNKPFYGMGYDKLTNMILGTDPVDYVQDGWMLRYNVETGLKVDSFKVGVIPGNFWFN